MKIKEAPSPEAKAHCPFNNGQGVQTGLWWCKPRKHIGPKVKGPNQIQTRGSLERGSEVFPPTCSNVKLFFLKWHFPLLRAGAHRRERQSSQKRNHKHQNLHLNLLSMNPQPKSPNFHSFSLIEEKSSRTLNLKMKIKW